MCKGLHLCNQLHTFLEVLHIVLDLHNRRNSLTSRTIGILLQQSLVHLQFLQKPDYYTLQFALLLLDCIPIMPRGVIYYWEKVPRGPRDLLTQSLEFRVFIQRKQKLFMSMITSQGASGLKNHYIVYVGCWVE